MNAILLAAGRGTRLGSLTASTPKPLLLVGGEPIISRIIRGLVTAGIRDIAIVTGYLGEQLETYIGSSNLGSARVRWFRQQGFGGTAAALNLARDSVAGGSFLFGWGDIVVEPHNYARVVEGSNGADGALAVNEVEDPAFGGAVYLDPDGFVSRLVEKPAPGSSATRWNNSGIGVLPPAIWAAVDALTPSPRGELELPIAIQSLVAAGRRLRAVPIDGPWFDIGTPESLQAARQAFGAH
ncbi:MAG: NDP-sugar synthase [Dehalococcoidia bacterium]